LPGGGGANAADHLIGKPGCLSGDCVPEFGARGDVTQSELRLVACEHTVRELERLRASKSGCHEALEFAAFGKLGDDALQHPITYQGAREFLGQRPGESAVEDAGDLGSRQHFVHRFLERPTPGAGCCPRREESDPPGRVAKPGAVLVVLRCHHEKYPLLRRARGARLVQADDLHERLDRLEATLSRSSDS
jgi:hypothetical protein